MLAYQFFSGILQLCAAITFFFNRDRAQKRALAAIMSLAASFVPFGYVNNVFFVDLSSLLLVQGTASLLTGSFMVVFFLIDAHLKNSST